MKKIVLLAALLMAGFSATCFAETVYVGNLASTVTNDDLYELVAPFSVEVVSATVIKDRYSGQSRGFGYIEVYGADAAERLIQELNDTMFFGRKIVVRLQTTTQRRR